MQDIPSHLEICLDEWDAVSEKWWYAIARDETEVHLIQDDDLGWMLQLVRHGMEVTMPEYDFDFERLVVKGTALLEEHDRQTPRVLH